MAETTREETSGANIDGAEDAEAKEPVTGQGPDLAKTAAVDTAAPSAKGAATSDTAKEAQPTPPAKEEASGERANDDAPAVLIDLPVYEGPLDLLLHLIRKHELDILDIPISFVTKKYLAYLDLMSGLQIDVASEYLVMAATLAHIKSKMLLPADPNDEGDDDADGIPADPRAELVKRLLEYQKYKEVAHHLGGQDTLDRDVFERGHLEQENTGEAPLAQGNVFRLFDAFERVLKRAKQTADHAVLFERVSIAGRIIELTEVLQERGKVRFEELFTEGDDPDADGALPPRIELVTTFLAILEMGKMRMIRIAQEASLSEIWVEFAPQRVEGDDIAPPAEGDVQQEGEDAPAEEEDSVQEGEDAPAEEEEEDSQEASTGAETESDIEMNHTGPQEESDAS